MLPYGEHGEGLPLAAVQVVNGSFKLDGLGRLPGAKRIEVHATVGWAGAGKTNVIGFPKAGGPADLCCLVKITLKPVLI